MSSFLHHSNMPHTTSFCFSWSNHSVATGPLCREDRQMVHALMKCCWILSCFHAAVLRYIIQHEILVISTMHCAKRDANHFCSKSANCNIYATNELISRECLLKAIFEIIFCLFVLCAHPVNQSPLHFSSSNSRHHSSSRRADLNSKKIITQVASLGALRTRWGSRSEHDWILFMLLYFRHWKSVQLSM